MAKGYAEILKRAVEAENSDNEYQLVQSARDIIRSIAMRKADIAKAEINIAEFKAALKKLQCTEVEASEFLSAEEVK